MSSTGAADYEAPVTAGPSTGESPATGPSSSPNTAYDSPAGEELAPLRIFEIVVKGTTEDRITIEMHTVPTPARGAGPTLDLMLAAMRARLNPTPTE